MKRLLFFCFIACAINLSAQTYSGGSGTYTDPYLISSKADMVTLANYVNSGTTYKGKFFRLTQSLLGSNALTTSIGDNNTGRVFEGVFDGNGNKIELNNTPNGVFGNIQNATIQNLGVSGTVSASNTSNTSLFVGGVCGYSGTSTIIYCYNTATISAVSTNAETNQILVGGICGEAASSIITNCFNTGIISANSSGSCFPGGVSGILSNSTVLNCYNAGNLSIVGVFNATETGGICGFIYAQSSIKNCFAANSSIVSSSPTGRIAGSYSFDSELSNNYALSSMTLNGSSIVSDFEGHGTDASLSNLQSQSWIQTTLGWDFNAVWQMSSSSSSFQGFPEFRNTTKPPIQYTITATSERNGNISPSGDTMVNQGGSLNYTFTPNSGCQIYLVWIDGTSNADAVASGTYTFTNITNNHSIEVVFRPVSVSPPTFSGGTGTQSDPYIISSKADMVALANAVEGGTTYKGNYFRLIQNLTGTHSITTTVGDPTGCFQGVFDGSGYEIELNSTQGGVFGYCQYATIQNLGVSGTISVSTASNAYLFERNLHYGGICGYSVASTIAYCYNTATVSIVSTGAQIVGALVGGICGQADSSSIANCFNTGAVYASSRSSRSGGIIGETNWSSTILNCYNTGNISAVTVGASWTVAGGISGEVYNQSLIKNCFSANASVEEESVNHFSGRITGNSTTGSELNNNYALSTMTLNGNTVTSSDSTTRDGSDASLANFQSQSWIQSNLGWDFNTIWQMSSAGSSNRGFPILKEITHYFITASSGSNGSISPSGNVSVSRGDDQTFTLTPNTGYLIDQVLVDETNNLGAVMKRSYTFTNVTKNHTIYVSFTPKQYMIAASAGNNGSISPNGTISVSHGSNQTFAFIPNEDYLIDKVLVDGTVNAPAKAEGSYTFSNVTSDHNISVSFKTKCLPIVVQVWDDVLSVINTPANNGGYTFTGYQWLKNGVEIPGETSGNLYLANDPAKATSQYTCRVTTSSDTLQSCPLQLTRSGVIAYPNPTEGKLTIESSTLSEGDRIEVYSSTGTLVKQVSADSRQTEINLGNLPKGIYVVKVNGKQLKVIRL